MAVCPQLGWGYHYYIAVSSVVGSLGRREAADPV